jgi:TRAP-type uncharacterized transport system substrate-binding protein
MVKNCQYKWQELLCRLACLLLLVFAFSPICSVDAQVNTSQRKATKAKQPADALTTAISEGEADEVFRFNNWTVGIMGGLKEGTALKFVTDLHSALDDGDNLRIVPIVSRGLKHNILDLLYLKGVDIVVTPSDSFEDLKKEGKTKNIDRRVHYITSLYVVTTHIIVRPEIKTAKDLEGKKISFQGKGTSTVTTGNIIFDRLGVKVEATNDDYGTSMDKMKRGELFGILVHRTKGDSGIAGLDPKTGFHLLSIPFDAFTDYYLPVTLDNSTYPNVIPPDEKVEAIGSPAILAVYNWAPGTDRHRKVARFIQYFFERFETLKKPPYQTEWKDINLGAKVPGWTRYFVAEEMLNKLKNANATAGTNATSATFTPPSEADFKEFLEWKKRNKQ